MACAVDMDCPSTLACYSNTSWVTSGTLRELPAGVPSGCGYSTWYGWNGDTNNTEGIDTPVAKWWLASSMVLIVISLVFLALNVEIIVNLMWKLKKPGDPKIITSIQLLVGALAMIGMQSAMFARIFFPSHATHPDTASSSNEKASTDDKVAFAFLAVTLAATLQALVSVGVVWVLVANAAQRLRSSDMEMRRVQRLGLMFEAFIAVAFIVILAIKYYSLLAIPVALIAIVVLGSYTLGLVRMRRLLLQAASIAGGSQSNSQPQFQPKPPMESSSSNNHNTKVFSSMRGDDGDAAAEGGGDAFRRQKFLRVLGEIYRHTMLVMAASFALLFSFILNMVFTVIISWKATCTSLDVPCYAIVNWQIISLCVLLINLVITLYLRSSVKNMITVMSRSRLDQQDSRERPYQQQQPQQRQQQQQQQQQQENKQRGSGGDTATFDEQSSTPRRGHSAFESSSNIAASGGGEAGHHPSSAALVNREGSFEDVTSGE